MTRLNGTNTGDVNLPTARRNLLMVNHRDGSLSRSEGSFDGASCHINNPVGHASNVGDERDAETANLSQDDTRSDGEWDPADPLADGEGTELTIE